jgi:glycosyltransferase involved in cell wall biosynthesis
LKICQLCAVDFTLKVFLIPLVDYQLKNGEQVISVCSEGEYVNLLQKEGYKIHPINISRSFNLIKHLYSIYQLVAFFNREKFDIVHVHTPIASILGRIAAKISRVPTVVYTAHGFYFHEDMSPIKKSFFVFLERFSGLFTDLLFTQSYEDSIYAAKHSIVSKQNIFAIGNGVDPRKFNPNQIDTSVNLREEFSIDDDAFLVGMIARQVKEKGILEFIETAIKLSHSYDNINFIIIGDRLTSDHNDDVTEKLTHAQSLLGNKLIITGMRSDIPQLLSVMNLFVLPSWREGMPRTIIEAMMMGLPVVATNIRGSREEVVDGLTGILVPVRDFHSLSKAIEALLLNKELSIMMGKEGRKRALDLYDENNIVKLQHDIINKYIKNNYKK